MSTDACSRYSTQLKQRDWITLHCRVCSTDLQLDYKVHGSSGESSLAVQREQIPKEGAWDALSRGTCTVYIHIQERGIVNKS